MARKPRRIRTPYKKRPPSLAGRIQAVCPAGGQTLQTRFRAICKQFFPQAAGIISRQERLPRQWFQKVVVLEDEAGNAAGGSASCASAPCACRSCQNWPLPIDLFASSQVAGMLSRHRSPALSAAPARRMNRAYGHRLAAAAPKRPAPALETGRRIRSVRREPRQPCPLQRRQKFSRDRRSQSPRSRKACMMGLADA